MSKIDKNEFSNKGRIRAGFENGSRNESVINNFKRLSKDEEVGRIAGGTRNVAATLVLRGYEEANFEKQQDRLIEWARQSDCLFTLEDIEEEFGQEIFKNIEREFGESSPTGGAEALVYRYDNEHLLKVIRYNVWDTKPLGFLDNRIALHNYLFPDTFYELIGICRRGKVDKFSFIVKQPFIKGTRPTQDEIHKEMVRDKKFVRDYMDVTRYNSEDYIINDLHTGNWIKGINEKMYCIDPAPCLGLNRKYGNIL